MRILILTRHFFPISRPSGVITLIRNFSISLMNMNHHVAVACIRNKNEKDRYYDDLGIEVFKFSQFSRTDIRKIHQQFNPDNVIIFSSISTGIILLFWWLLITRFSGIINKTYFYQTTNLSLSKIQKFTFRILLGYFKGVFVANSNISREIRLNSSKFNVLYPGVVFGHYQQIHHNDFYKKSFTVCFMGHLSHIKGADLVVKLAQKLPLVNFRLIAGYSIGKLNTDFYEQLVKQVNDIENLEHIGFTDKPIELLAECHLLILPYRSSKTVLGISQSAIEAMELGIPVLATLNDSTNEIVKDGYNGYFLESVEEFEFTIKLLLKNNKHYKDLSKNAKKTIKQSFSMEDSVQKCIKKLESF